MGWRHLDQFDTLVVRCDSECALQLSMGRWKVNRSQALAQRLKQVCRQLSDCKVLRWVWVKGHSGNAGNVAADALAARGRKGDLCTLPDTIADSQRRRRGKQLGYVPQTAPKVPAPDMSWEALSEALVVNAEMVVGRTQRNGLWSPCRKSDKITLAQLDKQVQQCYDKLRHSQDRSSQVQDPNLLPFRGGCRKSCNSSLQPLTAMTCARSMTCCAVLGSPLRKRRERAAWTSPWPPCEHRP